MNMATDLRLKEGLPEITDAIVATYVECKHINHLGHRPLPSREAVVEILCDLLDILYPGYWRRQNLHLGNVEYHVGDLIDGLHDKLTHQIARALRHEAECVQREAQDAAETYAPRPAPPWTSKPWPSRRPSSCSAVCPTSAWSWSWTPRPPSRATRPPRAITRSSSATPAWRPSPSTASPTSCCSWASRWSRA